MYATFDLFCLLARQGHNILIAACPYGGHDQFGDFPLIVFFHEAEQILSAQSPLTSSKRVRKIMLRLEVGTA